MSWSKGPTRWYDNGTLFVSIPFAWNLPSLRDELRQRSLLWDRIIVGGPAVELMPDFFAGCDWIEIGHSMPGVLQRVNPLATKTSRGCVNRCPYCAVPKIEGPLEELDEWPDLPVLIDNNLLACSLEHFDRVMDRLEKHRGVDFNQGLDARRLTPYHVERISRLRYPIVRLACDSSGDYPFFRQAAEMLLDAGVAKRREIMQYFYRRRIRSKRVNDP